METGDDLDPQAIPASKFKPHLRNLGFGRKRYLLHVVESFGAFIATSKADWYAMLPRLRVSDTHLSAMQNFDVNTNPYRSLCDCY